MNNNTIHIVAFDVPYPPNYGGIIDVFYKLKTLHQLGAKIIFHCYYYANHNPPTTELEKYCDTIYYYERKKHVGKLLMSKYPYIVVSRDNKQLLNNLLKDNNPILLEGLQCCYYLSHPLLTNRKKIVRAHNVEHDYYSGLAKSEINKAKQLYLLWEAKKLKKFEKQLINASHILSIAKKDFAHFSKYAKTTHIPPFFNHSSKKIFISELNETKYLLFQGNLSVSENVKAVDFILEKIAPNIKHQIIIAGKSPSKQLFQKINVLNNVKLIPNPTHSDMNDLIEKAHINLLLTFQQTGVKLKLLQAIELGNHIIINSKMDDAGIFKSMCVVEDNPTKILDQIERLAQEPFTKSMYKKRYKLFSQHFNNEINAKKITSIVF
jgi:hypothetical protein